MSSHGAALKISCCISPNITGKKYLNFKVMKTQQKFRFLQCITFIYFAFILTLKALRIFIKHIL